MLRIYFSILIKACFTASAVLFAKITYFLVLSKEIRIIFTHNNLLSKKCSQFIISIIKNVVII